MRRADVRNASRALLEPLRSVPIAVSSRDRYDRARARLVPRLSAIISEVPMVRAAARKRRRTQRYLMAAALVLGTAMVLGTLKTRELRGASRARNGTSLVEGRVLIGSVSLSTGDRFEGQATIETTEDTPARVVTESGIQLALTSASRAHLRPVESGGQIELFRGSVSLVVPPLLPGSSVSVITRDTIVIVHGTQFTVSYDTKAARPSTCVRVQEGKVSVHRRGHYEETLLPGQSSGCNDSSERDHRATASARTPKQPKLARPESTLAEENQMLLEALAAEQRQDYWTADATLRNLLLRYPRSPFASEARSVLSRIESRRSAR